MIIENVPSEERAFKRIRELGIGCNAIMVRDCDSKTGEFLVIYEPIV